MSESTSLSSIYQAFRYAFPKTIPILAGYGFLGLSYGIYMNVSGFPFWYPMLTSIIVFGGSLEFVSVSLLLSAYAPLQTLLMAVMIQARHLFYGIAMLEKYKETGWKKWYLIYAMSDETFSVNYATDIPKNLDRGWVLFFISLLDQSYWVVSATAGGILGSFIPFNTEGLDFVMTAVFVVIFLEQWLKEKKHYTACIGAVASLLCLVLFGADSFLIPTMICILVLLTVFRTPIEKAGGFA